MVFMKPIDPDAVVAAIHKGEKITLEPGHYEFQFMETPKMWVVVYMDEWVCSLLKSYGPILPNNIGVSPNLCTRALLADLMNRVLGFKNRYYNWEESRPCKPQ